MKWSLYKMNSKFLVDFSGLGIYEVDVLIQARKQLAFFCHTYLRMRRCYRFEVKLCPSVTFLIQIMSLELPPISRQ